MHSPALPLDTKPCTNPRQCVRSPHRPGFTSAVALVAAIGFIDPRLLRQGLTAGRLSVFHAGEQPLGEISPLGGGQLPSFGFELLNRQCHRALAIQVRGSVDSTYHSPRDQRNSSVRSGSGGAIAPPLSIPRHPPSRRTTSIAPRL